MKQKAERAKFILKGIEKVFPEGKTELRNWNDEFQFLVCVMLSAQTTDTQVNRITPKLFKKFPDLSSMSRANIVEVEKDISSINYYKTKSRHIIEMSKLVKKVFDSQIPKNVEELIKLPGVGKKTANVFLNELFHANQGIAVDTHVARVSNRLELTKALIPEKIASDLENLFPRNYWYKINTRFVLFGRYYCKARKPLCENCIFKDICSFPCS